MTDLQSALPASDIDFWSEEVLANPFPHYAALRQMGPAVWLSRHNAWAVVRHSALRKALLDGEAFSSAHGCMMNEQMNGAFKSKVMLCSDDPEHHRLRRIFTRPLMPKALSSLKAGLAATVESRVQELVKRDNFDAVSELAHLLPLTIVTDLVGLSDYGKANMLSWASGIFDAFGPMSHERTVRGMEVAQQAISYLETLDRENLDPDGWGVALFAAADKGEISAESARAMLMDYLAPALDTTINAISSAIALFAKHPDQWAIVRNDPARIPGAIDEVLRLHSPIRAFSRYVTKDTELDGVALKVGDRALMVYPSGNRDERRYSNPERFDVLRDARDHIGFGYGTHICAGMHLAKLEVATVLETLAARVTRIDILEESRAVHNTLWGISRLIIKAHTDK